MVIPASAGVVATVTCTAINFTFPCTSGTTSYNFPPEGQLKLGAPDMNVTGFLSYLDPWSLPPDSVAEELETLDITMYTPGPRRPGLLYLSVDGTANFDFINAGPLPPGWPFQLGAGYVVGFGSWICFLDFCGGSLPNPLPVTLGAPLEIILMSATFLTRGDDDNLFFGDGGTTFTARFTDPATGDLRLILSEPPPDFGTPEPASWLLLATGLCVVGLGHRAFNQRPLHTHNTSSLSHRIC
jgi:hypothetical protein